MGAIGATGAPGPTAQMGTHDADAGRSAGTPFRRTAPKVGRNDPCPCGSGRKFKLCCGKTNGQSIDPNRQAIANQTHEGPVIKQAITQTHDPKLVASNAEFRDYNRFGKPKASLANAVIAIRALGIEARYDLFHTRINVTYNGDSKTIREGLLTDDTVSATRSLINNTFQIDCGDSHTIAAIKEIAWDNAYDPVLDMLNDCQSKWDGVKRLDTWVIDYLGCKDTPLNRAIGRLVLIAACRRARIPGCKFDPITVLEGVEGTNKSTAIRVLAGDENFSDQSILGASDKEVQEQLDGIWMHENADLAGMTRAEIERAKRLRADKKTGPDQRMRGSAKIGPAVQSNGARQTTTSTFSFRRATGVSGRSKRAR